MSRRRLRLCRVLLAASAIAVQPAWLAATGVHPLAKALLTFGPQMPRMDQPWHLRAVIQSADGIQHPERRVRVIGEMTGHPMAPVEAQLTRVASEAERYEGSVAFTMPGAWRITLRVDDATEALVGVFSLDVSGTDGPTGFDELRSVIDLHQPVRGNLIPPWWIVSGTVLVVLAAERAAAAAARRRAQRATATASA